jgi:hypothetical protein
LKITQNFFRLSFYFNFLKLNKGEINMARHKVQYATMMRVGPKKVTKDLGGGKLGLWQIRKINNVVTDPHLLSILSCMAGELAGKKYGNLGAVQEAFKTARSKCR